MRIPYSSLSAFKAKANLLESLLNLKKRRQALELLAQTSGYANYHEVTKSELRVGQMPSVGQVASQLRQVRPELPAEEAHRIAEALALHVPGPASEESPQSEQEKQFKALYVSNMAFDKRAFSKFQYPKYQKDDLLRRPSFNPDEQAKALQEMRAPVFHLLTREHCPDHPDLPEIDLCPDLEMDYKVSSGELSEWWYDHIVYVLYPKYSSQRIPDDLTKEESEALWDFWRQPSEETAKNHRILAKIPDVANLARLWKPYHEQSYAQQLVRYQSQLTVIVGATSVPEGADWASQDARVTCTIAFKASTAAELEEGDDMSIWEYSACFMLSEKKSKLSRPIALMTGTHIVPFGADDEFSSVNRGYFADMMDAHSAMLNDVWKVLHYKFFRANGYGSVEDFAEDRMGESFTVVDLEIEPALRGKGLTPLLLNLFISTVSGSRGNELDANWQKTCGIPDDMYEESEGIDLGTPGVLIFPVEGTRPKQRAMTPARLLLVESPLQGEVTDKDVKAELRKEKLTTHFLALDSQVDADIVVYDPWEYPTT